MDILVGVDIGTSSAKAVSFDAEGGEHGLGEAGYALREPSPPDHATRNLGG
jgi:sugar (pentulose or hexulose) kinase